MVQVLQMTIHLPFKITVIIIHYTFYNACMCCMVVILQLCFCIEVSPFIKVCICSYGAVYILFYWVEVPEKVA